MVRELNSLLAQSHMSLAPGALALSYPNTISDLSPLINKVGIHHDAVECYSLRNPDVRERGIFAGLTSCEHIIRDSTTPIDDHAPFPRSMAVMWEAFTFTSLAY